MSLAYLNDRSWLARLGVDVKLFWAAGLTVGILFCKSWLALVILLFLLGSLGFYDRRIVSAYRKFIWIAIPATLIIVAIHLFYHEGEELFRFWIFTATADGVREGVINSLRFLNFGLVAIATIREIEPVDFGRRISWGLGLFRWRKLTDLSLVFFIAIRFVPSFVKETEMVKMAMIARGADFGGSIINRMRMNIRVMLPLFSRVIRQTDDIACAISLKGHKGVYIVGKRPSLRFGDMFLIFGAIIITLILALA
jgi:energy-coupling factor transport system permease protein